MRQSEQHRVAIITGSSRGIGAATARCTRDNQAPRVSVIISCFLRSSSEHGYGPAYAWTIMLARIRTAVLLRKERNERF
jgi:hypothetical protein